MQRILHFLQIKTIRSAWVFLVGTGLMFLFGIYLLIKYPQIFSESPTQYFELIFFPLWFLITSTYMAIGYWALFSDKGKEHLKTQEKTAIKGSRNIFWFFKFLFACYAAAFATIMFLGVVLLPFLGNESFLFFRPNQGIYFLVCGLIWSPLIFKYLK